jgi:hypothetical protein
VSQQWRDLQCLKRFGFGHDLHRKPGNGDLAYFCPACPQPASPKLERKHKAVRSSISIVSYSLCVDIVFEKGGS